MSETLHTRAILSAEERAMLAVKSQPLMLISDIAGDTGLNPDLLRHLVAAGVIEGDKNVCNLGDAQRVSEQIGKARKPLAGIKILVTDAVEKYGFSKPSIYRWIKDGWVSVIQQEPRVRVDEGDIAVARVLADLVGQVAGRSIFPSKPRPGRPRKARLSPNN